MNDEDKKMIEEAERLDVEATPGPWAADFEEGARGAVCHGINSTSAVLGCRRWSGEEIITTDSGCYGPREGDARLIVGARTILPRLAARLRAVLEELNDAKNERDAMVETNAANVHTSEAAQEAYFAIKDELDLSNRALALQTKTLAEMTKERDDALRCLARIA